MVEEKGSEGKAEEQPAAAAKEALPELFPKETPIVNKGKARKVTGLVELGPALRQENVPLTENDNIPQGQKTAWPWEKALSEWMGTQVAHRLVLRETMKTRFAPGPQAPLYSPSEWKAHVKSYSAPFVPKAEVMVQLLAVILQTGPGNPKKKQPMDLSEMCASIRCQKSELACLEMALVFDDFLDDLDFEPTSKEIACLYGVMESADEEWPTTAMEITPITQKRMYGLLAMLDFTLGNEKKLRHGRNFSTYSLSERTRRLSVNLQEAERNAGLFGAAVHGSTLESLCEVSEGGSRPVTAGGSDAFLTRADEDGSRVSSAVSSRPGSTSKREASKALRKEKQGNKKKNSLFDIDRDDPVWVKVAKLTLLEDEFKEMVVADELLLKLWNDVDTNHNGLIGLGEWNAFVKRRYPIIDHKKPMNAAFIGATQDQGVELFKDGGKATPVAERVLKKAAFKTFLQLMIKMTRLWYAYTEIDYEREDRVDFNMYKKGRRAFRGVLQMDNDVTVGAEIEAEFDEMDVGKDDGDGHDDGDGTITWTTLTEWWIARIDEDDVPWVPDPELDGSLNYGRTFDFDSLQDLVVHCHYVTRVATVKDD